MKDDIYYVYILRCEGDTLYTGIARDYEDRYKKHIEGKGAKYTRSRKPQRIEGVWLVHGRSEATKAEYWLKKNNRRMKDRFIEEGETLMKKVREDLGIDLERVV